MVNSLEVANNKSHVLAHQGQDTPVDTKTLKDIYGVSATPTLIFTDKKGQSIFIVPGYIPPEQFKVTLDFVKSKKWEGVDRKNGDVYQTLKEFYIKEGIIKE